jgi:hypothetical protein
MNRNIKFVLIEWPESKSWLEKAASNSSEAYAAEHDDRLQNPAVFVVSDFLGEDEEE